MRTGTRKTLRVMCTHLAADQTRSVPERLAEAILELSDAIVLAWLNGRVIGWVNVTVGVKEGGVGPWGRTGSKG